MEFLLDTNVMLRVAEDEVHSLPAHLQSAILDPTNRLFVSTASLWEIAIKHRLGKLPLPCRLEDWPEVLATFGLNLHGIATAHVLAEADPLPDTRDPFDRLLLAICQVDRMRLLSLDRLLAAHPLAWKAPA